MVFLIFFNYAMIYKKNQNQNWKLLSNKFWLKKIAHNKVKNDAS